MNPPEILDRAARNQWTPEQKASISFRAATGRLLGGNATQPPRCGGCVGGRDLARWANCLGVGGDVLLAVSLDASPRGFVPLRSTSPLATIGRRIRDYKRVNEACLAVLEGLLVWSGVETLAFCLANSSQLLGLPRATSVPGTPSETVRRAHYRRSRLPRSLSTPRTR